MDKKPSKPVGQKNTSTGTSQMWGGRFAAGPAAIMQQINASIDVDKRLYKEDIEGSLAHAAMLVKQAILSKADGEAITDSVGLVAAVGERSPGDRVELTVRRDDGDRSVTVTLGEAPDAAERAYVGVFLTTDVELPVDVTIDAGVIGGPSAGHAPRTAASTASGNASRASIGRARPVSARSAST